MATNLLQIMAGRLSKNVLVDTVGLVKFEAPTDGSIVGLYIRNGAADPAHDQTYFISVNTSTLFLASIIIPATEREVYFPIAIGDAPVLRGDEITVDCSGLMDIITAPLWIQLELDSTLTPERWVTQLYKITQDPFRPDSTELAAAVAIVNEAQIDSAGLIQAGVALQPVVDTVFTDTAYLALGRDDTEFVEDLYTGILGRPADVSGVAYWLPQLATQGGSLTRAQMWADFLFSSESLNLRVNQMFSALYPIGDAARINGFSLTNTTPAEDKVWAYDATSGAYVLRDRGGSPTRATAPFITSSLADTVEDNTHNVTLAKSYRLLSIQADRACRVRLYATAAARTADLTRSIGVDPVGNHGVVLDLVFTAADTWLLAPQVLGSSMESTPAATIPIAVQNRSGSTHTVALSFKYIQSEA